MKKILIISLLLTIILASQDYTALFKLQNGFKDTSNTYTLLRTNTSNNSQQDGRLPNTKAYKLNLMDYYYLPDNLVNQISGDFTIALWNKLEPNTYRNDFQIFQIKFNNIIFHLEQNSFWIDSQRIYIDVPSSKEDLWYHVAVTFKQNTVTVYIQGQKVYERKNQNYDKLTYVRICNAYIGLVQDIAVYNYAIHERQLIDIQNIGDDTAQDYTRGILEYYPISAEFTYNDTVKRQSGDRYILQTNTQRTPTVRDRLTRQNHAIESSRKQKFYPSSTYTLNSQQKSYSFMARIEINGIDPLKEHRAYLTLKAKNGQVSMPDNMDLRYVSKFTSQTYVVTATLNDNNSKVLLKYYIDGQLIYKESHPTQNSSFEIQQFIIGSDADRQHFIADDIAVWDRELTFTEIQQLSKLKKDIIPFNYQSFYSPNQQDCENMYKNYFKADKFDYDFDIFGFNSQLQYSLTIKDPNFKFIPGCFYPSLKIGKQKIDIPVHQDTFSNSTLVGLIKARFQGDDYPLCDYVRLKTTCDLEFTLTYNGQEILRKYLSSIYNDLDWDQSAKDLFSTKEAPIIKTIDSTSNPTYNLCTDVNCNKYKQSQTLKENEINYIELKIDSTHYIDTKAFYINGELQSADVVSNRKGSVVYGVNPQNIFTSTFEIKADYSLTRSKPQ